MIKIGVFVEGQTENIFITRLLAEYLGYEKFEVESIRLMGNKARIIRKRAIHSGVQIYVLIYDVGSDEKVVSALVERAEKMVKKDNYQYLLALRDLYPNKRQEKLNIINKVQKVFSKFVFAYRLKFVLAIMEIEAWFLADYGLFKRIDERLTPQYIHEKIGEDLIKNDPENYQHPAHIIDNIYRLIGRRYKKREKQCYEITSNIDYDFLCLDEGIKSKISSFFYFLKCIDSMLQEV